MNENNEAIKAFEKIDKISDSATKQAMIQLLDWGYTDFEKCLAACRKHNNKIEAVIGDLS